MYFTGLAPYADAATRAYVGTAPPVYIEYVTIPTSSSVVFETSDLTGSADPVLHLLRDDGAGGWVQVAINDDFSGLGLNSRISYTNGSAYTDFLLILRSYSTATSGTCDLSKGGSLHHADAPVGGWFAAASIFTFNSGDELRTVHHTGYSEAPALLVKFSTYYLPSGVALGNAPGGTARITLDGAETYFLVGTPQTKDGSGYQELRAGAALVMSNDVGSDADGDGIGDDLEAALTTCATLTGCGFNAANGSGFDTDRDGLSDGEEVFGVAGTLGNGVDDLPFARWGASPKKKDIFVEMDWLTTFGGVVTSGESPFQWIRDHPTGDIGPWKGTLEAWVNTARAPFLQAPITHAKNPDGSTGIEVHFDLGVAPLAASDEAKFGAWSNGSARAVAPDWVVVVASTITGYVGVTINGESRSFDATSLAPEWIAWGIGYQAVMTGEPIEFKSLDVDGSGVATLVLGADTAGVGFTRSLSVPAGFEGAVTLYSESSSSLNDHYTDDAAQMDAVRRGRMRYAILTEADGGGQAGGASFVSALAHGASMHELGHSVGLQHYGHCKWHSSATPCVAPEAACLPHYFSLMSYGYFGHFTVPTTLGFSTTDAGLSVNPAETVETDTFGSSFDHSVFLNKPYNYLSPTAASGVDWTRDGVLSGSGTSWRTMALSEYFQNCASFSVGRVNLVPDEAVVGPIDLVRFGTRLYAIWSTGAAVKYKFATLGSTGAKSCTGTDDPLAGACLTWSSVYTLVSGASYLGITAASHGGVLYIAHQSDTGALRVRNCTATGTGTLTLVSTTNLPTSSTSRKSDHAPELVIRHEDPTSGSPLGLIYLGQDGNFQSFGRDDSTGTWAFEGALLDVAGSAIPGGEAPVAKAWPDAAVTGWSASEKRTLAILPSATSVVEVYSLNPSSGRWVPLALDLVPDGDPPQTAGKPFLEYRALRDATGAATSDFAGHFMMGWANDHDVYGARAKFVLSSVVDKSSPPTSGNTVTLVALEAGDNLQNLWATTRPGSAAALYSDSTIDNVFGVVPLEIPGFTGINFYPHADGSPNHDYSVYSDFRVMEDYICATMGGYRGFACGTINVFD